MQQETKFQPSAEDIKKLPLKIAVLQRGHVLIGRLQKEGDQCTLHNAKVIRRWGTEKGLGQLAGSGATRSTVLDDCNGEVTFHQLTVVFTLQADESKWPGV